MKEVECPVCHGTGKIGTTDWLTKDMTAKQLAKEKEEAIAEFNAKIRAEAVKDFAEKIYRSCAIYGPKDKFNKVIFLNIVDQIAEELERR